MKLLKNRKFAVSITVAVIVLATLFGVHKSLAKEVSRVEALFYDGVEHEFLEPSIDAQLDRMQNYILGVAAVSQNYPELEAETEALQNARNDYLAAKSISEKSKANGWMMASYDAFYKKAGTLEVSERDRTGIESYDFEIKAAQSLIEKSKYNEEVQKYIDEISSAFPVGLLKGLVFVKDPQLF